MSVEAALTNDPIRTKGLELLAANLGTIGMVRFFQQTENGWGDYTHDRQTWLGERGVKNLAAQIKHRKQNTD
ncbi:hypothetical protein [Acanthopleuribacter pedis]|uniref:Uncharacterized protein n=1 Tax=Acanthopleuribacter pedis TaxID=442870 RepID=A0A8J7U3F4_9BACT|nr:hypothetical protein [Acanthopleuribacter pedis]MBO1318704.1 hypothetical protein [Acanthopleuribacter pedis]